MFIKKRLVDVRFKQPSHTVYTAVCNPELLFIIWSDSYQPHCLLFSLLQLDEVTANANTTLPAASKVYRVCRSIQRRPHQSEPSDKMRLYYCDPDDMKPFIITTTETRPTNIQLPHNKTTSQPTERWGERQQSFCSSGPGRFQCPGNSGEIRVKYYLCLKTIHRDRWYRHRQPKVSDLGDSTVNCLSALIQFRLCLCSHRKQRKCLSRGIRPNSQNTLH